MNIVCGTHKASKERAQFLTAQPAATSDFLAGMLKVLIFFPSILVCYSVTISDNLILKMDILTHSERLEDLIKPVSIGRVAKESRSEDFWQSVRKSCGPKYLES